MTNAILVDLMNVIYGKTFAINQRSLRTSKFRSLRLKKTHFNGAKYAECRYLEEFRSTSSAFPQIRISWDSSLMLLVNSQLKMAVLSIPGREYNRRTAIIEGLRA